MDGLTKKELLEIAKELGLPQRHKLNKKKLIQAIHSHQNSCAVKRKKIKDDLLDQLERSGVVGEFYTDLINDYMSLWDVKNMLIEDIAKKGVSVRYQNGENQFGYKKNDSVAELQRTNNQMLKLLAHLGLKPSRQDVEDVDYSDMEM